MTPNDTDGRTPPGGQPVPGQAPTAPMDAVPEQDAGKTEALETVDATDREGGGKKRSRRRKDSGPEGPEAEGEEKKRSPWRIAAETVVLLLIAAVIAVLMQSFFIKAFVIPSSSMVPTLEIGDRVMVEKVSRWFRDPRRKEIVVFRMSTESGLSPSGPGAMTTTNPFYWPFEQIGETLHLTHRGTSPYVKRVVALGGETVELRKGKLYIDGKLIDEPYAVDDGTDYGPFKVPKGYVFCMGDNRPDSRDSRSFGPVPVRSIIGRVFLTWWPLKRFTTPR